MMGQVVKQKIEENEMEKSTVEVENVKSAEDMIKTALELKKVFKPILFRMSDGNCWVIKLTGSAQERVKITDEVDELTPLETYKKYIVIDYPFDINMVDSFILSMDATFESIKEKMELKESKEGYAGIDVAETECYCGGNNTAVINCTGDGLQSKCVDLVFHGKNKCIQVNILNSFEKDLIDYSGLLVFKDCNSKTHTFINTNMSSLHCYSNESTFRYVSSLFIDCEINGLNAESVYIYATNTKFSDTSIISLGCIEYSLILRDETAVRNSLIKLYNTNQESFILALEPDVTIENSNIGFHVNTEVFSSNHLLGCYYELDLFIDINLLGIGQPNTSNIYVDQDDHPDDIILDAIILYEKGGQRKECKVVNLRLPSEILKEPEVVEGAIPYATYVKCFCGRYIPIGEAIRLYGEDSLNSSILKGYQKMLDKIIQSGIKSLS